MNTELVPIDDIERMAAFVVKSNLFGIKTPEQAITLMLVAQAEGLHPATAARDYHIIQGKPALKADAMLSRFQVAGGIVEWVEYTDTKVSGKFSHAQSPKPVLIEWTIEMAKRIGLATKDNWKNYPRQMLRARVISEGVRTCYPAIAVGLYTPEEVMDFDDKPKRKEKEVGAEVLISEAQHKRLEAIIGEKEVDRELVKDYCKQQFNKEHFTELTQEEHHEMQLRLAEIPDKPQERQPGQDEEEATDFISADQAIYLEDLLAQHKIKKERFLLAAKVDSISKVKRMDYQRALTWIEKTVEKT